MTSPAVVGNQRCRYHRWSRRPTDHQRANSSRSCLRSREETWPRSEYSHLRSGRWNVRCLGSLNQRRRRRRWFSLRSESHRYSATARPISRHVLRSSGRYTSRRRGFRQSHGSILRRGVPPQARQGHRQTEQGAASPTNRMRTSQTNALVIDIGIDRNRCAVRRHRLQRTIDSRPFRRIEYRRTHPISHAVGTGVFRISFEAPSSLSNER